MASTLRLVGAALLTAAAAVAQFRPVSCEFSPAFVVEGQPVTIRVRCERGISNPDACGFLKVHAGSQAGPIVAHYAACAPGPLTVAPWALHSYQWDGLDHAVPGNPRPVAPGTYWFHVDCSDAAGGSAYDDWFCLTVVPANPVVGRRPVTIAPVAGTFQIGATTTLRVESPDDAGSVFQMFLSFDSKAPVALPGVFEFGLSLPIYLWGTTTPLDLSGGAVFPLSLPNQASLVDRGFVLQAQVIDISTGFPRKSNCLPVIVKP